MVEELRVSEGTGAVLKLWNRKMSSEPTTGYLMTPGDGKCKADCGFCPQALSSDSGAEKLSRVSWPREKIDEVLEALEENGGDLSRVCVQALNYPGIVDDLCEIVGSIGTACDIPISVSCQPLSEENIRRLSEEGIDRIGIPLDAATPDVFDRVKGRSTGGPYRWRSHLNSLKTATEILGERVSTHLIVGLGESEREMVERIQFFRDRGITVALFAFTPIEGTKMADRMKPSVESYRRIQIARHLIFKDLSRFSEMEFAGGRITGFGTSQKTLEGEVESGKPFLTSGCPGCNRPFYNESPGGPIYNYPREPTELEIEEIVEGLDLLNPSRNL